MVGAGVSQEFPSLFGYGFDTATSYYMLGLAVLFVAVFFARNVWKSGLGLRMRAVRDNEDTARAFTVNPTAVKLQAFGIAGFLAGLAGSVYGGSVTLLTSGRAPARSIEAAAVAVLGGLGPSWAVHGRCSSSDPRDPDPVRHRALDQLQLLAIRLGWSSSSCWCLVVRSRRRRHPQEHRRLVARRHGLDPRRSGHRGGRIGPARPASLPPPAPRRPRTARILHHRALEAVRRTACGRQRDDRGAR